VVRTAGDDGRAAFDRSNRHGRHLPGVPAERPTMDLPRARIPQLHRAVLAAEDDHWLAVPSPPAPGHRGRHRAVFIRCYNGPELTANALPDWCHFTGSGTSYTARVGLPEP
jgi:hypothetical protein